MECATYIAYEIKSNTTNQSIVERFGRLNVVETRVTIKDLKLILLYILNTVYLQCFF